MNPRFFFHKMREVKSFLQIMRGKLTGRKEDRIQGVDNALKAMEDEKKVYLNEQEKARKEQSGTDNRDVSAI